MTYTKEKLRLHDMEDFTIVSGKPGKEFANTINGFGDREINAHRIVKCVNGYDEVVGALENLVIRFAINGYECTIEKCNCNQFLDTNSCRHVLAKQALKNAGGGK